MTITETATVEVLTAEVRVLQVGRRQITLSVYRQLDAVDLDDIELFGRINDGGSIFQGDCFVVGRRNGTGELVRSSITGYDPAELDELKYRWRALPLIVLAGLR